jgi:hypothetical protein
MQRTATNFCSTTLQEKKNDLEAYIYTMRDKVSTGELQDYISQADKEKFLPMLDEMENWLYEEEAETGRLRWLCWCGNCSTGAWGSASGCVKAACVSAAGPHHGVY